MGLNFILLLIAGIIIGGAQQPAPDAPKDQTPAATARADG